MIAYINITVLFLSLMIFFFLYLRSLSPSYLEKRIGEKAYKISTSYRMFSLPFINIVRVNYIIYFFYPLPLAFPRRFFWGWPLSLFFAFLLMLPYIYLLSRGLKDAGKESFITQKEHKLYNKGIYRRIRHPQHIGVVCSWWILSFLLDSPFLTLLSLVWVGVYYKFSLAEEKDLELRFGEDYLKYKRDTGGIFPRKL